MTISMKKWIDFSRAKKIVQKLQESKSEPGKNGWVCGRKGYKSKFTDIFEEYEELLCANFQFSQDVPPREKKRIVGEAIFACADKAIINIGAIAEFINKGEKQYLTRKNNAYVFLSTLSIPYSKKLRPINSNDYQISFCKRKPVGFDTENTQSIANRIDPHGNIENFTYVKMKLKVRCQERAFYKAKTELDFIIGIWNFSINLSSGRRKTFGIPEQINKVCYGPCYTIHREDGSREDTIFWYSEHIVNKASLNAIDTHYETCKKNERIIRKKVKQGELGDLLRTSLIRYTSALEDGDMTSTFLKLWSLLEHLTITGTSSHVVTAHRSAQVYKDKDIMYVLIDYLREKRNKLVHVGDNFESGEDDAYRLLQYVNTNLEFLINNMNFFQGVDQYKDFLSLPHCEEDANKKQLHLKNDMKMFKQP